MWLLAAASIVLASWYGPGFHGRTTANGETYNQYADAPYTAAHKTLPFGTRLRVTYPRTGASIIVCVNDRGPYWGERALDLNRAAADTLGIIGPGVDWVEMEVLGRPSDGCQ